MSHWGTVIYTHSDCKVADTIHLKVLGNLQVFHLSLISVQTMWQWLIYLTESIASWITHFHKDVNFIFACWFCPTWRCLCVLRTKLWSSLPTCPLSFGIASEPGIHTQAHRKQTPCIYTVCTHTSTQTVSYLLFLARAHLVRGSLACESLGRNPHTGIQNEKTRVQNEEKNNRKKACSWHSDHICRTQNCKILKEHLVWLVLVYNKPEGALRGFNDWDKQGPLICLLPWPEQHMMPAEQKLPENRKSLHLISVFSPKQEFENINIRNNNNNIKCGERSKFNLYVKM